MTDDLQIPTKEIQIGVAWVGGEKRQFRVYLAPHELHLIDLLERQGLFLPAFAAENRSWSFVNKRQIIWASLALVDGRLPIEQADDEPPLYDRRAQVELHFALAEVLRGEILYTPPQARGRLSDHINENTPFLRVWTADSLYIVNKEQVLRLIEVQEAREEG